MPYELLRSMGTTNPSVGSPVPADEGSYWVTGWPDQTRQGVTVGSTYTLRGVGSGDTRNVQVLEIGGAGKGGIRFKDVG